MVSISFPQTFIRISANTGYQQSSALFALGNGGAGIVNMQYPGPEFYSYQNTCGLPWYDSFLTTTLTFYVTLIGEPNSQYKIAGVPVYYSIPTANGCAPAQPLTFPTYTFNTDSNGFGCVTYTMTIPNVPTPYYRGITITGPGISGQTSLLILFQNVFPFYFTSITVYPNQQICGTTQSGSTLCVTLQQMEAIIPYFSNASGSQAVQLSPPAPALSRTGTTFSITGKLNNNFMDIIQKIVGR